MENALENSISKMTDQELEDRLNNTKKYSSSEITYSVEELRKRGKFNELDSDRIQQIINLKIADESKPKYYSEFAIYAFTVCCSVLFGAILLAMNVKDRRRKWIIIGYAITYTVFTSTLTTLFTFHETSHAILNAVGCLPLGTYFWAEFVGKNIEHKNRPIWIPLGIVAILFIVSASGITSHNRYIELFNEVFQLSWR